MLKRNRIRLGCGVFLLMGLAFSYGRVALAADKTDYTLGDDGKLYFMENGGEMIGEDEDYIIFECKPQKEMEHGGTASGERSSLVFSVGISNKELNISTKGQDPADENYPGYNYYPTQRSDLYLTIGDEKNQTNHPIDDFLALPVNSLSYEPDVNYDRDYVWTATFKSSDSFYREDQPVKTTLKSILAELKKPGSFLKIASWNKTIRTVVLPPASKLPFLAKFEKACIKAGVD